MPFPQSKGQIDKTENLGKIVYVTDGTSFFPAEASTAANSTMGRLVLGASTANIGDTDVLNVETIQTELYAASTIAAGSQAISSTISLVGVKKATFFIDHARTGTAAWTINGTEYRVEVSQKATGNDTWRPITSVLCASAVAASCAASAGAGAAGTSVINTVAGTAMVLGDIVTFTSGTIEWVKVTAVGGTAQFTIQDGLTADHTAATGIFGGGQHFPISLNVEAVTRARVVINNNASTGTNQAMAARVACITEK